MLDSEGAGKISEEFFSRCMRKMGSRYSQEEYNYMMKDCNPDGKRTIDAEMFHKMLFPDS